MAKDLARSIPTEFPSATPAKQPGWEDAAAYDPQVLSAAYGRGVTSALEGTKQLAGTARDYLTGLMQSVRERSPAQLQGTAPVDYEPEVYEFVTKVIKPVAIHELDTYLPNSLQQYKAALVNQSRLKY